MPKVDGAKKQPDGTYLYKGWRIWKLTPWRWRGTYQALALNSITRPTMHEVCEEIDYLQNAREEQERKSI